MLLYPTKYVLLYIIKITIKKNVSTRVLSHFRVYAKGRLSSIDNFNSMEVSLF